MDWGEAKCLHTVKQVKYIHKRDMVDSESMIIYQKDLLALNLQKYITSCEVLINKHILKCLTNYSTNTRNIFILASR